METKSLELNTEELFNAAKSAAMERIQGKLDRGEKLSGADLDRLTKWRNKATNKGDLVSTKTALAAGIPCSVVTLDKYWNVPGHPKHGPGTWHSLTAWRQFIATVSELKYLADADGDNSPDVGTFANKGGRGHGKGWTAGSASESQEDRDLKRRRLIADAERAEVERDQAKHDLEVSRDKWIKKEDAAADVRRCNEAVKQELVRRFRQTAPAEYEACGGDIEECRRINEAHLAAALEFIHTGNW